MHLSGEEIRERRSALGWSQQELADRAGVGSKQYISQIESGKRSNVSPSIMVKICDVLDAAQQKEEKVPFGVRLSKLKARIESKASALYDLIEEAESLQAELDPTDESPYTVGDANLILARLYRESRRFPEAVRCASVAQEIFSKSGDVVDWCSATMELAAVDYDRSEFASSLERFLLVEKKAVEVHVPGELLTRLFVSIAQAASAVRDVDLMNTYIEKSDLHLSHVAECKRLRYKASLMFLQGDSMMFSKAYKSAVDSFTKAQTIYEELNEHVAVLAMCNNITEALLNCGEIDEAQRRAEELLRLKAESESTTSTSLAETKYVLASVFFKRNMYDQADSLCREFIDDERVDISRRALGLRMVARTAYCRGDVDTFNRQLTEAVLLLNKHKAHQSLLLEITHEYMIANHKPSNLTFG